MFFTFHRHGHGHVQFVYFYGLHNPAPVFRPETRDVTFDFFCSTVDMYYRHAPVSSHILRTELVHRDVVVAGQAQSVVWTLAADILDVMERDTADGSFRDTADGGVKQDTTTDDRFVMIVIQRHEHGQRNNPPETDKYKY
jgi:hypothetical protein